MLMQYISSLLKVFCCILYLKCFKRKITKLSNFFYVVKEMRLEKYINDTKILVAILATVDFSVPVYFLLYQVMNIYFLVFLLIFQFYYLFEMITRRENESEKNCDCFVVNLPRKISFRSILANMLTSYVYVMIFVLDNM